MATFTYIPSTSFSSDSTPRVLSAQFGDGYSQRLADGINTISKKWSISFNNRSLEDSAAIVAFFQARKGVESFTWTPTGEATAVQVVASSWKEVYSSPITRTISVTFDIVYES
jgi:phage-related protein